jgi:hypothetical protein
MVSGSLVMRLLTSIATSYRSALLRRFYFKGGNLPYDLYTRAFWALNFLLGLALVLRDAIGDLETFAAFLALKFVSGHPALPAFFVDHW